MYCMFELHWTPDEFYKLTRHEKAFISAAIDVRSESEKKAQAKSRKSMPRKRR